MTKNLILTSSGLKVKPVADQVLGLFHDRPDNLRIAHIITAANVAPDIDYMRRDKHALKDLGFDVTDVELEKTKHDELHRIISERDIIYVQGGNGFYLMKHIHRKNNLLKTKEWL